MAYRGSLEESGDYENKVHGEIIEDVPIATLKDFLEETYDEMFSRGETAIVIYIEGRPCFRYIERRFAIEC